MSTYSSSSHDSTTTGEYFSGTVTRTQDDLYDLVRHVRPDIALGLQSDVHRVRWNWLANKGGVTVYDRTFDAKYSAFAHCKLDASLEEVQSVLQTDSSAAYQCNMVHLHGKEFLFGDVVHAAPVEKDPTANKTALLTVKTAVFARKRFFRKHQQMVSVDYTVTDHDKRIVMQVARAVDPTALLTGFVPLRHVDQLDGIVSGYALNEYPDGKAVKMVCYAAHDPSYKLGHDDNSSGDASKRSTRHKVLQLATSTRQIQRIIRRRRLGFQTLTDTDALADMPHRKLHCTSCTKGLSSKPSKRAFCNVCGNHVCPSCVTRTEAERAGGAEVRDVAVCTRCLENLDRCVFRKAAQRWATRSPTRRVVATGNPDAVTAAHDDKTTKHLVKLLSDSLLAASGSRKSSVVKVIRQLLREQKLQQADGAERRETTITTSSQTSEIITEDVLRQLDAELQVESVRADECVFAEQDGTKKYTLTVDQANPDAKYPIPANEQARLRALTADNALQLPEIGELDVICALAAKEMDCMIGAVTLISDDQQIVLASTAAQFHRSVQPRDQSVCTYTVMTDQPFVVEDGAADVRFQHLLPVQHMGLSYYCGFPITGSDGTPIGSVCCFNNEPKDMTDVQYSTMKQLAKTASRVVQIKGKEIAAARS